MNRHSRRGFLKTTLGACWTGAALLEQSVFRAAQARAQSASALPTLFDIEKVAEGIYAAVARPAVMINCNAAIFENSADLLIVDTHSKPSAVASLVSQIRKQITTKPVRYIVNSHFHWDHSQGNPAYRRIAPHADVVASAATRRLLSENGAKRAAESVEQARKSLATYKENAGTAKSPEEKAYWQRMGSETAEYISEMRNYAPELPNVTLERDLVLHDKAHDLHLVFRGRGHTAGDVVVWCPQKKVVATGDLLHGFAPYIGDGYPLEWPRTLHSVAECDFGHVIGGHAAVQHTRERLGQMATYIEELTEAVVVGRRQQKSVERLQQEITPATLKSLSRGYGDFISASTLRFGMNRPGLTAAEALVAAVRSNTAHIHAALERG